MLLVSWNVAGLSTTVNRIHDSCISKSHQVGCSSATTNRKAPSSSPPSSPSASNTCTALAAFLQRHGNVDILCLQEHKIPRTQLTNRTEPRHASNVPGYESFWCCCVDENSKGMNGVCTYARIGSVVRADAAPLKNLELDQQGRCIMTDHGNFIVFNVYVPATGGQPLSYKLKFLRALRQAMQRERTKHPNKSILLVGDLNITHTSLDVYWSERVLYINEIIHEVRHANGSTSINNLPKWKHDIAEHWDTIVAALETLQAVPTTTRNTKTNEEFQKFRARVTLPIAGGGDSTRSVFLGKHETCESYCLHCYEFLTDLIHQDEETGEAYVVREANVVSIGILVELLSKIAGVMWSPATQREIADQYGTISRASPTRQWLTELLERDNMIDPFRYLYPNALGRFTCWHQFTNRRYYNEGLRIDYTLIDRALLDRVQPGSNGLQLRCGGSNSGTQPTANNDTADGSEHHLTEEAALAAATANGRFVPVSFEGGGIQEASRDAIDSQYGEPHTGMIYTPPSFSDHIAISLLLSEVEGGLLRSDLVLDVNDAATKKSQPHKLQTTIASFFGAPSSSADLRNGNSSATSAGVKNKTPSVPASASTTGTVTKKAKVSPSFFSSTSSPKPKPTTKPKTVAKNSILNHFRPTNKKK